MVTKAEPVERAGRRGARVERSPGGAAIILQEGITYAEVDGRSLELDVARPAAGGPFPLLLVFPGNGWGYFFWFDRRACREEILEAASRGYVAAAIDYRPATLAGFDGALHDAGAAFDWLCSHAAELGADAERIAVSGFSSGGQLALLLSLRKMRSSAAARRAIRAVIVTAAPADMRAFESRPFVGALVRKLLGGRSRRKPDCYRRSSPATNVSGDMPPVLVLHGKKDRFVPVQQSLILEAALRRANVPHRLVLTEGCGHRDQWRDPVVWSFLSAELRT